ncbi:hypothetical protein NM688_g3721 [Phlebia brevispora]|uniref:Uncharacterized protein n=1 Tax=Phlebia brevispora TaxID=194682 RepID=A0ACC1T4Q5_9APHY|nr:hypothetical protein NM688_g3721 [Phlebia brevispora]
MEASPPSPHTFNNLFPVELIRRMFQELAYERHPRIGQDLLPPYHWLTITHVCRYWRNIALDDATLWQCLEIPHAECLRAFIARSKKLPLYVMCFRAWEDSDDDGNLMRIIIPELYRVAVFIWSRCDDRYFGQVLQILVSHARSLEHLEVCPPTRGHSCGSAGLVDLEVFDKPPPYLTHFKSEKCAAMLLKSLTGCPRLRTLDVTSPNPTPSANDWLTILSSLPTLETLRLYQAISDAAGHTDDRGLPSVRVHLAFLSQLSVRGSWDSRNVGEVALLERLSTGRPISLHCEFYCRMTVDTCQRGVRAVDALLSRYPRRCAYMHMYVEVGLFEVIVRQGTPTPWSCEHGDNITEPLRVRLDPDILLYLVISSGYRMQREVAQGISRMLASSYSLSDVQDLRLTYGVADAFHADFERYLQCCCESLFRAMGGVRTLSLTNRCHSYTRPTGLALPLALELDLFTTPTQDVLFPNLQLLHLQHWESGPTNVYSDGFAEIVPYVRKRAQQGHPINSIHLCRPEGGEIRVTGVELGAHLTFCDGTVNTSITESSSSECLPEETPM